MMCSACRFFVAEAGREHVAGIGDSHADRLVARVDRVVSRQVDPEGAERVVVAHRRTGGVRQVGGFVQVGQAGEADAGDVANSGFRSARHVTHGERAEVAGDEDRTAGTGSAATALSARIEPPNDRPPSVSPEPVKTARKRLVKAMSSDQHHRDTHPAVSGQASCRPLRRPPRAPGRSKQEEPFSFRFPRVSKVHLRRIPPEHMVVMRRSPIRFKRSPSEGGNICRLDGAPMPQSGGRPAGPVGKSLEARGASR
jgi:hypothetical protein